MQLSDKEFKITLTDMLIRQHIKRKDKIHIETGSLKKNKKKMLEMKIIIEMIKKTLNGSSVN